MPIRLATTAEPAAMAAVHAAAFPSDDAWSRDVFYLQLVLPGVQGLLDQRGGVVLFRIAADEAEILTLAVVPESRRLGIASGLLTAVIEAASRTGAAALFLEVSITNTAARALYGQAGFAEVGHRPRYYADGSDALVLRRSLR